jgi:hypothetical protein
VNELTLPDHFISTHGSRFIVGVWTRHSPHLSRLQKSARVGRQIEISLASIQSSLLLLAEVERSNSARPMTFPLPEGLLLETVASQRDNRKTEARSRPIWWDIDPAVPKAIRLGEVEAADKREAIEKAAKRFQQDPAVLLVERRF